MAKTSCVICASDFLEGDELKITQCGHMFHSNCIRLCLDRSEKCPKCEQAVTQSDIHSATFGLSKRSESNNSKRNEEKMDEFQKTQNEILKRLLKMKLRNRKGPQVSDSDDSDDSYNDRKDKRKSRRRGRRTSTSDSDDDDSPRSGSSRQVAERNAAIVNKNGTVIKCQEYRPMSINVNLSLPFSLFRKW